MPVYEKCHSEVRQRGLSPPLGGEGPLPIRLQKLFERGCSSRDEGQSGESAWKMPLHAGTECDEREESAEANGL